MHKIDPIGIIAGRGLLPLEIAKIHTSSGARVFIAGLDGVVDRDLFSGLNYEIFSIGKVGAIIEYFKSNSVKDLIFAGKIERPDLKTLKVDLVGSALLAKILMQKFNGDDALLRIVADFLEGKGLRIISAKDILSNMSKVQLITNCTPSKQAIIDIALGRKVIESLGELDVGQSVIVAGGRVLGIEAAEGTDNLIKRCANLRNSHSGGVLVKMMKSGQDARLDIPTIGPTTLNNLVHHCYSGIAIEQNGVIVVNPTEVNQIANKGKLFIDFFKANA